MKIQRNKHGFTLLELMIGMIIFGVIMMLILESVWNITIARTRTMSRISLLEELYTFSEKLTTSIKDGGIIDYEEYWNRKVIGTATQSGHYRDHTGYGNYGSGGILGTSAYGSEYYYCISSGSRVGTGGCLTSNNSFASGGASVNYSGSYQRYGQYGLQFMDYNGNNDADGGRPGDEDGNGNILDDEDDKDIGDGPIILSESVPELYLINTLTNERLYFRWIFREDPGLPPGTCVTSGVYAGSGCLGNIEVLRLVGRDRGLSHSGTPGDPTAFDGKIDTWVCHPDWSCSGPTIIGGEQIPTGNDSEWVRLFPDYVNVKRLSFSLFPEKDPWKSWNASDCLGGGCSSNFISPFLHPYVQLQMTLGLAWEKRRLIRGDDPTISVSTTISLTGY